MKKTKKPSLENRLVNWMTSEDPLYDLEKEKGKDPLDSKTVTKIVDDFLEEDLRPVKRLEKVQLRSFDILYNITAVVCCIALVSVLLFTVAKLPPYGALSENARPLAEEYLKEGMGETGATNIVAAMILCYRAFDTLGESFVLFTALCCVQILLRIDSKNERDELLYRDLSYDPILKKATAFIGPIIILYGIYVMLNGHLSPGGGFSGGAITGAGLILLSSAYGFEQMDRFITGKVFNIVSGTALGFYALSKTYSFLCEANGHHTGIPTGIPGTLLSGGLILPLNIAVGMVVAFTMFGLYCLFRRGSIGHD